MKRLKYPALLTAFIIFLHGYTRAQSSQNINCDSLRLRCYGFMTGGEYSLKDPLIRQKVGAIGKNALNIWKTGFVSDTLNRKTLWKDLNFKLSADITTCYTRLLTMAIAYSMPGTEIYHNQVLKNDIIGALDWLYANKFNERTVIPRSGGHNNWWDYRIGSADRLCNILLLMYDELNAEQRNSYFRTLNHSTPTADTYTGANLLWVSRIIALNGILSGDPKKVLYARDAIKEVFSYVKSGDGFYTDGSFIQHNKHPYTGGYGAALLGSLAELMYLLPSIKEISESRNVYGWIYEAFEPLIYKGGMMSMSMGREISRIKVSEHGKGKGIIESMILLASTAPPEHAAKIRSLVRMYFLEDKTTSNYIASLSSISMIKLAKPILEDKSIVPEKNVLKYRQFANMDRAVQHNENYAFAISMHSSRIYNFESINEENLKGWHTSDGMTYLYNPDQKQFEDNFWATVDYQRLPGTTVVENSTAHYNKASTRDWVGGASVLGKYGVTGMDLAPDQSPLSAKKSWFMFDNEIVALGAGINSESKNKVLTVIEQRKLQNDNSNAFTVDSKLMPPFFAPQIQNNVKWAHLEGAVPNSDIGYYFPGGMELSFERKEQSGKWSDVRTVNPDKLFTRNYLTLWKDHGTTPLEDTYSYVLLPGFSKTKLKQYATSPEIEILENTSSVQAVKELNLNLIAANFWKDSLQTISVIGGQPYLTANKKAAVLVMDNPAELRVSVSDPTMKNSGITELEIHTKVSKLVSKAPEITVVQLHPVLKLAVNTKDLKGRSLEAVFSR